MNRSDKTNDWHKEVNHLKAENQQLVFYQQDLEEALSNIRKELVMDFHDNLGSQLARLAMFAGTIQNDLESPSPDTAEALRKIQQMSADLSGGIKDFIWSVDPKNDNLREVFFHLKDFGEELFEHTEIRFMTRVDDTEKLNRKLFHSFSRHLIPIFKEGLTNCFRHAECRNVVLAFKVCQAEFEIRLEDDGKGISPKKKTGERGIRNMYKRAGEICCQLRVESAGHQGTVIVLNGPIPMLGEAATV